MKSNLKERPTYWCLLLNTNILQVAQISYLDTVFPLIEAATGIIGVATIWGRLQLEGGFYWKLKFLEKKTRRKASLLIKAH